MPRVIPCLSANSPLVEILDGLIWLMILFISLYLSCLHYFLQTSKGGENLPPIFPTSTTLEVSLAKRQWLAFMPKAGLGITAPGDWPTVTRLFFLPKVEQKSLVLVNWPRNTQLAFKPKVESPGDWPTVTQLASMPKEELELSVSWW